MLGDKLLPISPNDGAEPDAHLQAIELAGAFDTRGFDVLQVIIGVVMMMGAAVPIIQVMIVAVELLRKVDLAKIEDATKVEISEFFARSIGATLFRRASWRSVSLSFSGVDRSVLLSTIKSAKAICLGCLWVA